MNLAQAATLSEVKPAQRGPWGPWLTLALGTAIIMLYSSTQGVALIPVIALGIIRGISPERIPALAMTGFNLAIATAVACPLMLVACGFLAYARRGPSVRDYLAVRSLAMSSLIGWSLLMLLNAGALSAANELLHRPVPEFVRSAYASAGHLPIFWFAIAFCAPLAEEVFFRGFLYSGLAASRLGIAGTIAVTSVLFMCLHLGQYGWVDLLQVGWIGILLGLARWQTGSLIAPLSMHIVLNLTALALYEWTEH